MAERKYGEPAAATAETIAGADWYGRHLHREQYRHTLFVDLDLTEARCQGGSIRDSDLSGAWLHSADFSGCDLRGTDLGALEPRTSSSRGRSSRSTRPS